MSLRPGGASKRRRPLKLSLVSILCLASPTASSDHRSTSKIPTAFVHRGSSHQSRNPRQNLHIIERRRRRIHRDHFQPLYADALLADGITAIAGGSRAQKLCYGSDYISGAINVTSIEMVEEDKFEVNGFQQNDSATETRLSSMMSMPLTNFYFMEHNQTNDTEPLDVTSTTTTSSTTEDPEPPRRQRRRLRNAWSRRHARSAQEGIRREKLPQLSSLLQRAAQGGRRRGRRLWNRIPHPSLGKNRHYAARTLTGLINALADEVGHLDVQVDARRDTPLWGKQVDAVRIQFSRLGFKPLRMGGVTALPPPTTESVVDYDDILSDVAPKLTTTTTSTSSTLSLADEAFRQIDVDNSGALDRDEIAQILDMVVGGSSVSASASPSNDTVGSSGVMDATSDQDAEDRRVLTELATDLLALYDFNGDGVVDRAEYQCMVEDMAALQVAQKERMLERQRQQLQSSSDGNNNNSWFSQAWSGARRIAGRRQQTTADVNGRSELVPMELNGEASQVEDLSDSFTEVIDPAVATTLGSITLSDLKLDLRRLVFGAVPIIKHLTPGGPLILEPFTVTVTASFSREDIMNSFLLDAGLRTLISFVLRRRVRKFRDLEDFAVLFGRDWKMASATAPVTEATELTSVEFDDQNRLIMTGRARIRTRPDAATIEQAFKVRAKVGTNKAGKTIRLVEPELAFVLECPKDFDVGFRILCEKLNMEMPKKPEPLYTFFPIHSPFKVEDENEGFNLGEDNTIHKIFIKDGALRFEMSAVLRPGRFLGSHYIAFTIPNRTFIITVDRVKEGMRAARRQKKAARQAEEKAAVKRRLRRLAAVDSGVLRREAAPRLPASSATPPLSKEPEQPKSFLGRFVDGYFQADRDDKEIRDRMTSAIREFFGRQAEAIPLQKLMRNATSAERLLSVIANNATVTSPLSPATTNSAPATDPPPLTNKTELSLSSASV